jgi:hypothetical protein
MSKFPFLFSLASLVHPQGYAHPQDLIYLEGARPNLIKKFL